MSRKFLVPIDLTKNELQNAVIQNLGSNPGSPVEGQVYQNTTSHLFMYHNGTTFVSDTDRSRHTGTQAWSTITATPTTLAGYGITDAQALDADLTAIAALSTTGIPVRTAANTWAIRTLASTTTALTITNPDGVSGNPSFAIADVVAGGASGLMTGADKTKLNGIATGATANSSDAFLLNRANHTGTQLASTISDFDTQVRTSRLDQMAAPTASVSMNSQLLTNLLDPVSNQDGATKKYVDDKVAGLNWKDEVMAATTANGALATAFENGDTIDGYTLVTGDRILIKNQTTASENGIYVVNASGAPTRASDADTGLEMVAASVYVVNGTVNGGSRFTCNTTGTITLGSTSLTFVSFGGGTSYTNGNGLSLIGNVFAVVAGTGITVGTDVAIDTSVVARKSTGTIGNGVLTTITYTHSLSNQWVTVMVIEVATLKQVECDVELTSSSQITLTFSVAPTTNQYRVIVTG